VENLEELVVEGLGFGAFARDILPFLGKARGAGADFVPAQPHVAFRPLYRPPRRLPLGRAGSRICVPAFALCATARRGEGAAGWRPPPQIAFGDLTLPKGRVGRKRAPG